MTHGIGDNADCHANSRIDAAVVEALANGERAGGELTVIIDNALHGGEGHGDAGEAFRIQKYTDMRRGSTGSKSRLGQVPTTPYPAIAGINRPTPASNGDPQRPPRPRGDQPMRLTERAPRHSDPARGDQRNRNEKARA